MLSTKVYKSVYELAQKLMQAASKEDSDTFHARYAELKAICVANEDTEKNHAVQWETLADFTEDADEALALYTKALAIAVADDAKDYMASIAFSMASLQVELGQIGPAVQNLQDAKINACDTTDKQLEADIDGLLATLTKG